MPSLLAPPLPRFLLRPSFILAASVFALWLASAAVSTLSSKAFLGTAAALRTANKDAAAPADYNDSNDDPHGGLCGCRASALTLAALAAVPAFWLAARALARTALAGAAAAARVRASYAAGAVRMMSAGATGRVDGGFGGFSGVGDEETATEATAAAAEPQDDGEGGAATPSELLHDRGLLRSSRSELMLLHQQQQRSPSQPAGGYSGASSSPPPVADAVWELLPGAAMHLATIHLTNLSLQGSDVEFTYTIKVKRGVVLAKSRRGIAMLLSNHSRTPKPQKQNGTKAAEPLATLIVSSVLARRAPTLHVIVSILPIPVGVALAGYADASFTTASLFASLTAVSASSARSVLLKSVSVPLLASPLDRFAAVSALAAVLFVPVVAAGGCWWTPWAGSDSRFESNALKQLATAATLSGVAQSLAFTYLRLVGPLEYAVANVLKRILTITASIVFYRKPTSRLNMVGMVLANTALLRYFWLTCKDAPSGRTKGNTELPLTSEKTAASTHILIARIRCVAATIVTVLLVALHSTYFPSHSLSA
ncbi:hypothetical protein DFJ73DRAFT_961699 [Zopfochytrium polystomum]|nr:hypothetical protein DFJ73DRAFT_961699 [Zopfochytrium polystomum]